jgi:CHAT domain-containing protein
MFYRKFAVAGLVMGLVGLIPVKAFALPAVGQTITQLAKPQSPTLEELRKYPHRLRFRNGQPPELERIREEYFFRNQKNEQFQPSLYEGDLTLWTFMAVFLRDRNDTAGRNNKATAVNNLGSAHQSISQYKEAIIQYKFARGLFASLGNRKGEAVVLNNLGYAHLSLSEYENAIASFQQALSTYQQVKSRDGEAGTLNNFGYAYLALSQYEKAISYFQQALSIYRQVKSRDGEATVLNNLGLIYLSRSDYKKAIIHCQQALDIFVQVKNRYGEAVALNRLGNAYQSLSQYENAIAYYQQALAIFVKIEKRNQKINRLRAPTNVAKFIKEYNKAVFRDGLPLYQQVKSRDGVATVLNNLGYAYLSRSQYKEASIHYQQALSLFQQVKDREGEGLLLSNLGTLLTQQKQQEVAIAFYKQSVNVRQTIRAGIRGLPRESQESYTQSVAGTYRALADLLLSQGRIAEAQQVLELLKLQELRDFYPDTRTGDTPTSIALSQSETSILTAHTTLIAFAQTMQQCYSDSACAGSPRLQALIAQRDRQNVAFANLVKTLETQLKQQVATDIAFINPNDPKNDFRRRAEEVINSQPGTLLIYPLVLEDKLWLLVGSPGPVFTRYEVKVGQKELADTVLQFRTEMKRCETTPCTQADTQRVKQVSQKLYQWMFPPQLQKELQAIVKQPIRNLVFAPDRSTRYIPMGALFDGEKYLIERYTVSTIVAASKTDAGARLPTQPNVLAMGLSDAVPGFNALPNVPIELDAIVKTKQTPDAEGIFPGNKFLNQAFTKPKLQIELPRHQILHLATHAKFEPGASDRSFLVLGDGYHFKSPDIQGLNGLPAVHLVVLSACETALGGRREQDGIEIAGINNAFLERGAKSVIASLWQVNDPSTSLWMQQFYQNLARGNLTKSQAIQNVQLNFLSGKISLKELQSLRAGARRFVEGDRQVDFTHPYYWAPFILIGNAL